MRLDRMEEPVSFEIMGRDGKLTIDGLGGSYGTERLTYHRMLPQMGPPETTVWEFPFPDRSFADRVREFRRTRSRGAAPVIGDHRRCPSPTSASSRPSTSGRSHDYRTISSAHQPRRRRHRPASYYREHEGFLIAAAIDKYVYVSVIQAVPAGHLSEIFRRSSTSTRSTRSSTASSARRCELFRGEAGPDRDHDAGRHSGRHRPRLVRQFHHGAAAARCTPRRATSSIRANWPSRPATSRSTC